MPTDDRAGEFRPDPPWRWAVCPRDGAPLVSTFEVPKKEWWCGECRTFSDYLSAQTNTMDDLSE